MIEGRCPTCSRPYRIAALGDLPSFPFCSTRCRLIDVGRWTDGRYVIPGSVGSEQPGMSPDDASAEESD